MVTSNELERANLLQMSYLASALRKIIKQYEQGAGPRNHDEIVRRGKHFIACILAGSLLVPRRESEKLLPEGIGLYETARAYAYAQKTWAVSGLPSGGPQTKNEVVDTLELYIGCLEKLERRHPLGRWAQRERAALRDLAMFFSTLERILVGELNSRSMESLGAF